MQSIFESERLLFREFTTDDAPLIYRLNSDPEVVKYVHEEPVIDIPTALTNLNKRILPQYTLYGYGRWAMHTKSNNEFIGWCGLKYRPERQETDLGYRFIQSVWGQGYATEAGVATVQYGFRVLGIPVITAMAHIENLASLKVLEKLGFQYVRHEQVDGCPVKTYQLINP